MRVILVFLLFVVVSSVSSSSGNEEVPENDIAAAEEIILAIKIPREAAKRADDRATQALVATEDVKKEIKRCGYGELTQRWPRKIGQRYKWNPSLI